MSYKSLYSESQKKHQNDFHAQQRQYHRINNQSNSIKLNQNSNIIIHTKLLSKLEKYDSQLMINYQDCMPILYQIGIFHILCSMQSIKQQLQLHNSQTRMKQQARFIYTLWKLINEEYISIQQFKNIILLLNNKAIAQTQQLKSIFKYQFGNQQAVNDLIDAWICLCKDKQYYQKCGRKSKSRNHSQNWQYSRCRRHLDKKTPLKEIANNGGNEELLSPGQEKQLINRLYQSNIYKQRQQLHYKKLHQQNEKQMQECTFKPKLMKNTKSTKSQKNLKNIKGYSKAIQRMHNGIQKSQQKKRLLEHYSKGQRYYELRNRSPNPPKFLNREKNKHEELFTIEFELTKYKVKVTIHQGDNQNVIASSLCKIYALKQEYHDQIVQIIRKELNDYYRENTL